MWPHSHARTSKFAPSTRTALAPAICVTNHPQIWWRTVRVRLKHFSAYENLDAPPGPLVWNRLKRITSFLQLRRLALTATLPRIALSDAHLVQAYTRIRRVQPLHFRAVLGCEYGPCAVAAPWAAPPPFSPPTFVFRVRPAGGCPRVRVA